MEVVGSSASTGSGAGLGRPGCCSAVEGGCLCTVLVRLKPFDCSGCPQQIDNQGDFPCSDRLFNQYVPLGLSLTIGPDFHLAL